MNNKSAIDLVVHKVFFAFEDDRLSTVHHFQGPDGVRRLTTLIVEQEKLSSETVDDVYKRVMDILDEIATNRESVDSQKYKSLYYEDLHERLRNRDVLPLSYETEISKYIDLPVQMKGATFHPSKEDTMNGRRLRKKYIDKIEQEYSEFISLLEKYNETEIVDFLKRNKDTMKYHTHEIITLKDSSNVVLVYPPFAETFMAYRRIFDDIDVCAYVYKNNERIIKKREDTT